MIRINACIESEGGHACGGALGELPIEGYFTSFDVKRYEEGSKDTTDTHEDPFWKSPRGTIEGKIVRSSSAYSELGLSPGAPVRVLARESDASFRESYFPMAELALK